MKAGIIGFGVIGKVHAEIMKALGAELCICDTSERARAEAKMLYPDAAIYEDYRIMTEREMPQAVHICTPHYLHAEMIVYALKNGCNVLSEKPMCIRAEDIPTICELAAASGKQFGVCQQNRYNPSALFAKEYLKNKRIDGAYATVVWNRDAAYYASGDWRGKRSTEGGGVLINQALHMLDLAEWFTGMPKFVTATVGNYHLQGRIEVEDTATLLLEGGCCPVAFYATTAASVDFSAQILLQVEGKRVEILPTRVMENGKTIFSDSDDRVYAKNCYGGGHGRLIADFYDCLETGRQFPICASEAAKVVRTILAAYASEGKRLKI